VTTNCVSNIHETPVPATVTGTFRNAYNSAQDAPTAYCGRCAQAIEQIGFFTSDQNPTTKENP
jgi:hypothetical protein